MRSRKKGLLVTAQSTDTPDIVAFLSVLVFAAAICFSHIHQGSLSIDSVRYAHIANAMLESGDWRMLYDEFRDEDYNNKPPILLWLTAFSIKALGLSTFAAKLPAATFVFIALLLVWDIAARLHGQRAAMFALLLFTANRVFFRSTLDLNFESMLLCGALCYLRSIVLVCHGNRLSRGDQLVLASGVLLFMLSKPPFLILLSIPSLTVALHDTRFRRELLKPSTVAIVCASAVLGASWMLGMKSANAVAFVSNQFLQPLSVSEPYWKNLALWLRAISLEFAPMTWIGLLALSRLKHPRAPGARGPDLEVLLYQAWVLPALLVVLFSDFQARYLSVFLIPCALVGGNWLSHRLQFLRAPRLNTSYLAMAILVTFVCGFSGLQFHRHSEVIHILQNSSDVRAICLGGKDNLTSKPSRKRMTMLLDLEWKRRVPVFISTTIGRSQLQPGDLIIAESRCIADLRAMHVKFALENRLEKFSLARLESALPPSTRTGANDGNYYDYH